MNPSKSGAASKVSIHRHNAQIKFPNYPKLNQFTERRSKTDIQNTHQIKLYMILEKKKNLHWEVAAIRETT